MRAAIRAIVTAVAVSVLVGSGLVSGVRAEAAQSVHVSASTTAAGTSAARLSSTRAARTAVWRSSGRVAGSWLQTTFDRPTVVDATTIHGAGGALRIADARLLFSDGSVLAVHTTAGGSRRVVFAPRTVRWVRLVVSKAVGGQTSVGLDGWSVRRSSDRLATRPAGDAGRLATVSTSTGGTTGTKWSATRAGAGQWIQLRWKRPVEVSALQLAGGAADGEASIRSSLVRFSDGSTLDIGTLEPREGSPTTVAFTPRTITALRLKVTSVAASARAALQRLSVYAVGSVPPVPRVAGPTFTTASAAARSCGSARASAASQALVLLCPSNGSRVSGRAKLVLAGPAGASLSVSAYRPRGSGGSVVRIVTGRFDRSGTARISVPMRALLHGPTAVKITAGAVKVPLYVQFVNDSGVMQRVPASAPARGMDLKYREQFNAPLSVSRSGASAQYASGKPNGYGVDDFGDAIFAQPTHAGGNLSTLQGGYLRIRSTALRTGQVDPAGFGRRAVGGLVSSAHMGGSGFSAQYGYFEARMLGPAGAGTWPAFWLLSTGSLYGLTPSTAEIDAVELYGDNTQGACQTVHSWMKKPTGKAYCAPLRNDGDWALKWHTYGARVTPTGTDFYIDGALTAHAPVVVDNDQSFFFLVNLALGGGWPVNLSGTRSQVDLYVDSIRVWV